MATLRNFVRVLDQNKVILGRLRTNQAVCAFATSASEGQSSTSTKSTTDAAPSPTQTPAVAEENKSYKSKDYYSHNEFSYYDVDADMSSDRIKQPSKYTKVVPQEPPKK